MQIRALFEADLKDFAQQTHLRLARGARNAAEILATRAKLKLRQDTLAGGLGAKVANAWRSQVYPKSASAHTHAPAVQVWSNAPLIAAAFKEASTIRSKNGVWLAIPTENVPRRRGRKLTPVEIEAQFNQDLIFFAGRGQQMLAFVNATRSKGGKGFRRATKRRTKDGRAAELVLMFVMVRQVHLTKRLNWVAIYAELGRDWPDLLDTEIAKALAAGAN